MCVCGLCGLFACCACFLFFDLVFDVAVALALAVAFRLLFSNSAILAVVFVFADKSADLFPKLRFFPHGACVFFRCVIHYSNS